MAPKDQFAAET